MKATCIIGSARSHGSTAHLIRSLIRGMEEQGVQCVEYCLGEMDVRYCQGCKRCYQTGQCHQQDDVSRIVEDILSSDIVAIAAPSYWGYVPGQLKTFFDRNTPYGDTNLRRAQQAHQPIRGIPSPFGPERMSGKTSPFWTPSTTTLATWVSSPSDAFPSARRIPQMIFSDCTRQNWTNFTSWAEACSCSRQMSVSQANKNSPPFRKGVLSYMLYFARIGAAHWGQFSLPASAASCSV